MFGVAFERLGMAGAGQGVVAAETENVLLWPLTGVLDRLHPDVRSGAWPPLARNPHAFAQEVLGHAVFGAVLGALAPRRRVEVSSARPAAARRSRGITGR